ncbi:MFS transporter [Roseospira marina]|uniref:MFS transporter n=1 Tax=Roseospira marina TaxID=140057 RepID=A0A5M6I8M2_9PROT|nr:MFS transporter [Roseospira marina]KAA5604099.1 MFS transporter [Roseospira marina]MBB4315801.1 putative MFS family arabinose efflux permease [Roseospira marina]MBB5088960.1 putative MFS family arabinose efflux permease [Roseospira marina]
MSDVRMSAHASRLEAPFPWAGLLALSMAAFLTILTEALPAGLLPAIGQGLGVSEAGAGQLVTVYAIGSLVAAIPLTTLTQGLRRRPLLMTAILGFLIANTVTALSTSYALTLVARFVAGVAAGLLWALAAGYAARMAPDHLKGRAIAVAMAGTPLALSLGVPAGTFLGSILGWRACFGLMSGLTLGLIVWVMAKVPDFPGEPAGQRRTLRGVLTLPGIRPVLGVVLTFVLAHNILYTYIAPYLGGAGMVERTDTVLLVFGLASLVSIWIVGVLIDSRLRALTLSSVALFALAAILFWLGRESPVAIYAASAIWGLAFGGCATLFQTASAKTAGPAADLAQSMLVTMWNTAIAGGGLAGGLLLESFGPASLAPSLLLLIAGAWVLTLGARRHGFPAR